MPRMSGLPRERASVLGCELQPPQLGNPLLPEVSRLPPASWSQGILLTSPGQGDRVCEFRGCRGRRGAGEDADCWSGHRGWLTSGQQKGLEGHPQARKGVSPRGVTVSSWSCHLRGPDGGTPPGGGALTVQPAPQKPGLEVRGHSPARAWTHTDIHKEGSRGFGVGNETQTGGLIADRSPPSWRRASGISCVQGLPRAPGHGPFRLRQGLGCWRPRLWQRHPRLPPSSHDVSLGDCVCAFLVRTPVTWMRVHPAAACPQTNS